MLLAILLFFLAASPIFYTIKMQGDFAGPVRGEQVKAITYEGYLKYKEGFASAPFVYFQSYIASIKAPELFATSTDLPTGDPSAFFVTFIGLIFATIGVVSRRKTAAPIVILLVFSSWATLGFNAYLPQILFKLRFPFIGFFREWFHFFVVVNFSLSALGALGFAALFQSRLLHSKSMKQRILFSVITGLIGIIAIAVMAVESDRHFSRYLAVIVKWPHNYLSQTNTTEFLDYIKDRVDSPEYQNLFFVYHEYDKLYKKSNGAINGTPFSVSSVYNDINLPSSKGDAIDKLFDYGLFPSAVTATIPLQQTGDINIPAYTLPDDVDSSFFKDNPPAGNHMFPRDDYTITPTGLTLEGNSEAPYLIVFPYGFKLGLKAFLNDREVKTYPVYNEAMTGVFVPKGEFDLKLVVPYSWYFLTVIMQAFLMLLIFLIIYWTSFRKSGDETGDVPVES